MLKKEGVDFSLTTVISEVRHNTQKKSLYNKKQQWVNICKKISKINLKYVQYSF